MNKQSQTQTQSIKIDKNSSKNYHLHIQPRFANLTKVQFTNWLKQLPAEERYLALKVKIPHLCTKLIALNSQIFDWEKNCSGGKKPTTRFDQVFLNSFHSFIDGAVLISEDQHLDCFGFDFSFVRNPQKLYECLTNLSFSLKKREKQKSIEGNCQLFIDPEWEQWIFQILKQIEFDYSIKMKNSWESILIEKEKTEKKQFGKFWKNLFKQNKIDFLYLGEQSMQEAAVKLRKLGLTFDFLKFSEDVLQNLELDKKNICNKIFKCKLKKCSLSFCKYYELLFQKWRQISEKKMQSKSPNKKRNKRFDSKRQKSSDTCSNETNQTQLTSSRTSQQSFHQIIEKKIVDCYNQISETSNMFHQKRVLAFERISAVFRIYGIECKLFGSCANGITIKNSDVDIAINQKILSYFQMHEDRQTQMSSAFEFMGQIFESLPWISNVKVIKTASTPIIKLIINTQIQVEEQYFTSEYRQILNRKICNGGFVQADLTIQDTGLNHLGIVSTSQINTWLENVCTLRPIVVLLKDELSQRSLNETYLGGLNTYCLVVMLVAFIYQNKLEKQENVSVVFQKILKFYGQIFDQKMKGIDIREKHSIFYLKSKDEVNKFADLQIKDPLNQGKIMTKNCYGFSKIKDIFKQIYETYFMRMEKDFQKESLKGKKIISKQKTEEESETESCEEKENKNHFIELII